MKSFQSWSARGRFFASAALGVATSVVAAFFAEWQLAALLAWDVTAGTYVGSVWMTIGRWDAAQTQVFATREDDSRTSARLLLLGASVASLVGVAFALAKAHGISTPEGAVLVVAALLTVVLSWTTVHTVYALHYADEYYTPPVGGIDFKNDAPPDYQDFAYVAFTVGMTFQVSDTDIQAQPVRRTILRHALLAYLFGAVILAVTVNVIANLLQ